MLAVGFAVAIACVVLAALAPQTGVQCRTSSIPTRTSLAVLISKPDFLVFFVAFCAGIAGMLSLTTAKSAASIGVFISIRTIPAAADAGIASSYGDWSACRGALGQLLLNLGAILLSGTLTLLVQRLPYRRGRRLHLARFSRSRPSSGARPPVG